MRPVEDESPDALAELGAAGSRVETTSRPRLRRCSSEQRRLGRLAASRPPLRSTTNTPTIRIQRACVVTGGAGFIGSNLVDALLARGDEVVVVDDLSTGKRENVAADARLVELDIRSPALARRVRARRPRSASTSPRRPTCPPRCARPDFDAEVNVVGTRPRAPGRRRRAHVVFSSTGGAIYGECERPAREDDPRRPLSPYGVAKLAGEEYLAAWNRLHGTRHTTLRFANVYGPRQEAGLEGGVVAIFLDAMAAGEETAIFGDGGQTRDFVHVDDVVSRAARRARTRRRLQRRQRRRDDASPSCTSAAARSPATTGRRGSSPPREGDVRRSVLDVSLAERELGWRPQVSLDEGLRRTWDWIQARCTDRTPEGARRRARITRPPWTPAVAPAPSSSAPGAPPRSSPTGVAAVELVLLVVAGARPARALDRAARPRRRRPRRAAAEAAPLARPPKPHTRTARTPQPLLPRSKTRRAHPERQRDPRRRRAGRRARPGPRLPRSRRSGTPRAPATRLAADVRRPGFAGEAMRFAPRPRPVAARVGPLDGMKPAPAARRAARR